MKIEVNEVEYEVTLAVTEEEKEQGLQNTIELPEGTGMLFVYDEPDEVSFWMQNTLISLDIVFIDEYGEVISVTVGQPNDETPITEQNVKYVLEVNAKSGIKTGDEVDLSELDEDEEEEDEEDEETEIEEEKKGGKMAVLDEDGSTQMELEGGERIFSRPNTKKLISLSKKAVKSKKESDYKKLGKKVFEYIERQNTQKQEFTEIEK
jgi:uncharacterized membrane protein (UPF0127 family)